MVDVTESTFENDVMQASQSTAIVVDLWAPWCGPCKTLANPRKGDRRDQGPGCLATVNVDGIRPSRAFQVQSFPQCSH